MANLRPADTPLWTSGPTTISFTGDGPTNLQLNQLIFSGINTLAPDQIFWSVSFSNLTNNPSGNFGPKFADPSTVSPTGAANDPNQLYQRDGSGIWMPSSLAAINGQDLALNLTLNAVPEPSAVLLFGSAAALGLVASRRRP